MGWCDMGEIVCHLDAVLEGRGMTLAELSRRVGVTQANMSILKNNRAKAIRFTTLVSLCQVLGVQPGELFTVVPDPVSEPKKGGV